MAKSAAQPSRSIIDLSLVSPFNADLRRLERLPVGADSRQAVELLATEENPRRRAQHLCELFRKIEVPAAVDLLRSATRMGLDQELAGLRVLMAFLEVRRPGVEVMRQLNPFRSLERTSLRLVRGTAPVHEDGETDAAVFQILESLEEATRLGVIDLGIEILPRHPGAIRALLDHVRGWFAGQSRRLEEGARLDDENLNFITQLSMLEIALMEKRVSHLASVIDPYDSRGIGRLMPLLSFYDQDIEHLKDVVSRLATYQPFHERLMTMEHALSETEMDRIAAALQRDAFARPLGQILAAMRGARLLDREYAFLVSAVHQMAVRRGQAVQADPPDVLSTLYRVLAEGRGDASVEVVVEDAALEAVWEVCEGWGAVRATPSSFEVGYREDRAGDLIMADGVPRLPEHPGRRPEGDLSLRSLVAMQMNNEPFILGVLSNTKASSMPGIVPYIAAQSRSLRVLDRILAIRRLHTGPANKDVPRILLTNPARIPINSLKPLIHVRFVSRMDLERLARPHSEVRAELRAEINSYLRMLKQ